MPELGPLARSTTVGALLLTFACSGSFNCSGCLGGALDPIPGGFPADKVMEKSAQVHLTRNGMSFFENRFGDLASAFATAACGNMGDPPCGFGLVCDSLTNQCVDSMGDTQPVLGFEIERAVDASGATVCRDAVSDPMRRDCYAWLYLEGLALAPRAPNFMDATVTARVLTTSMPIRYDPLGMDCLVLIDSTATGAPEQDIVLEVELREWAGGGRQLEIAIENMQLMLSDMDITISRDPIHGGVDDLITCGLGNIGAIKRVIIDRMVGSLTSIIDEEIRKLIGWPCNRPGAVACPADTHCGSLRLCVTDADGTIVPQEFGLEGRLPFDGAVPGLTGEGDTSMLVGGQPVADSVGVTAGVLGGFEAVLPISSCAMNLPSPLTRMGFVPPRDLPTDPLVDLDFDGTPETSYMVSAGVSQQLLDQAIWTIYSTGIFCATVDSYTIDLINTGSLSVLMPSLRRLTHSDIYDWSVWPARLVMRPGAEPRIRISTGEVSNAPADPMLAEPLLIIELRDLELYFSGFVEERWVHLATMVADVELPLGIYVTPGGTFEILIGDVEQAITNVRVSDHEILAETAMELKESVPALLALVLPQITQFLNLPFALPGAMELNGFDLDIVGIRGVEDGAGGHDFIGVYLDMDFDPALAGNLSLAAETVATVRSLDVPESAAMGVDAPGAPARPEVVIALGGQAPAGRSLEHQYRVDGSLWSPFLPGDVLTVRRPELLVQGHHQIDVRARVAGEYRSLDATPVELEVLIDSEPPTLQAWLTAPRGGILVHARDVISGDRVVVEVGLDGEWQTVTPDADGFVSLPQVEDASIEIRVAATDEAGRRAEQRLRAGFDTQPIARPAAEAAPAEAAAACRCAKSQPGSAFGALSLLLFGVLLRRRRQSLS